MFGRSFSHDDSRLLASSDETGVFNVYAQPIARGERTPLTASTDNATYAVSYFPNDDRFLFTSDRGGNELSHLYVMTEVGKSQDLTPSENTKSSFVGWSGDKDSFWVLSNERDPKAFDLYRYQTSDYKLHQAGIQARMAGQLDWHIQSDLREPRFINLLGIDSPGMTASLAIGHDVGRQIGQWGNIPAPTSVVQPHGS